MNISGEGDKFTLNIEDRQLKIRKIFFFSCNLLQHYIVLILFTSPGPEKVMNNHVTF